MASTYEPETEAELLGLVQWAAAEETPPEILGRATRRALGSPVAAAHELTTKRLTGIKAYEPSELYVTAAAGTPFNEVAAALRDKGQHFAFEPRNLARVLGVHSAGTMAGVVATALSGPRRPSAGAVRDHFLGFRVVSGRGEVFKSGGTVVKNVTGYDLSKLITGSFGTLAVMSEVTVRTAPLPREAATVAVYGAALSDLVANAERAARSGGANGWAFLAPAVASHTGIEAGAVQLFRFEGDTAEAAARAALDVFRATCDAARIVADDHLQAWAAVRDLAAFANADPLWRVSLARTALAAFLDVLPDVDRYIVDWDGRQIWFTSGRDAEDIRVTLQRSAGHDGHATLIRAAHDARRNAPVFQPQSAPLAALTRRIKGQFDPKRILNPGRFGPRRLMHLALPSEQQSAPLLAAAAEAVGACVHCGFCNATCPTYALLSDERDGPRGRIYAIKKMLENAAAPAPAPVPHL